MKSANVAHRPGEPIPVLQRLDSEEQIRHIFVFRHVKTALNPAETVPAEDSPNLGVRLGGALWVILICIGNHQIEGHSIHLVRRRVVVQVSQAMPGLLARLYQGNFNPPVTIVQRVKAMSWQYANKLEEQLHNEVQELLKQAEKADVEDRPEIDIPEELARREDRLAAIKKAKEAIKKRARERFESEQSEYEEKLRKRAEKEAQTGKKARGRAPKAPQPGPRDKDQVNFTDEESRIMPSSEGFVQGYNAQAAVDVESHLVVENHLSQCANDQREIESTLTGLERVESQLGKVENLLADAGYFSAANVDHCEGAEIVPYISDHREQHNLPWNERFETPAPCPPNADAVTTMAHRLSRDCARDRLRG